MKSTGIPSLLLTCSVPKVIGVDPLGQRGAGQGLHRADDRAHLSCQLLSDEGEGETSKVGTSASATHLAVQDEGVMKWRVQSWLNTHEEQHHSVTNQ